MLRSPGWFLLVKAVWKEGNPIAVWSSVGETHMESDLCQLALRRYEIEAQRHLDSALQARLRMALSFFGCSMSVLVASGSCITLYNSFAA